MSEQANTSDRPNILVILADQLRRSALGCGGDRNVATPHIDRLAAEGARFANACSTYPVCVPARFTLMTGEYAHSRAVPAIGWRMSPAERTIGHELADVGYQTAYVGKWHLFGAHPHDPDPRLADRMGHTVIPRRFRGGFEVWRGFEFRNDPFNTYYFADDDPTPRRIEEYQTDGLFDIALRFLARERDRARPFFLVLSVEPPHPPLVAPSSYADRWRGREVHLPPNVVADRAYRPRGANTGDLLEQLRAYYAMVENLDDNVRRLTRFLDTQWLRDTTAVVLLSDHGELMGSHGLIEKQHPYEESVGIPLIVSHPGGGIRGGRVLTAPTCSEDWFPTLRGLANLAPDTAKPGEDLTPLMRGQCRHLDRAGVLLEFVAEYRHTAPYHDATWRGIRTERYKYLVLGGAGGGAPWQLFDLQRDPYELHNLLDQEAYQETAGYLHDLLRETMIATEDHYVLRPAFGHAGLNDGT